MSEESNGPSAAYALLRSETVQLLHYPASLSLTQNLFVDAVTLLRLQIDTLHGRVLAGEENVDLDRLSSALSMLQKILPAELKADPPAQEARYSENRAKLEALINATIAAGDQDRVSREQELEREVERLRAELARARGEAVPAPAAPTVENVVPLKPRALTPDEQAKAQFDYSERLKADATKPRDEPWRNTYSSGFNVHGIPKDF
jgi:hypothetical protein